MKSLGGFSTKDYISMSIATSLLRSENRLQNDGARAISACQRKTGVLKPVFGADYQAKYPELGNDILQLRKNIATEEVYLRLFRRVVTVSESDVRHLCTLGQKLVAGKR